MEKIICVGNSITLGAVGRTFIYYLKSVKALNRGVNGDPILGIYRRLRKLLANPRYNDINTYVIEGGTNDILIPAQSDLSAAYRLHSTYRPRFCHYHYCQSAAEFCSVCEKIINILQQQHKKIIFLGLPKTELKNFPLHAKFQAYNQALAQLCTERNVGFIDTYAIMDHLDQPQPSAGYSWGKSPLMRGLDALLMLVLPPTKNLYPKLRGLKLTVDGVHFSPRAAQAVAQALEKLL